MPKPLFQVVDDSQPATQSDSRSLFQVVDDQPPTEATPISPPVPASASAPVSVADSYAKVLATAPNSPFVPQGKAPKTKTPGLTAPEESTWRVQRGRFTEVKPIEAVKTLADKVFIEGPSNIIGGTQQVFGSPRHPEDKVLGNLVPRERVVGAGRVASGVGDVLLPVAAASAPSLLANMSKPLALELAGGLVAPLAVQTGMEAAGADPDVTQTTAAITSLLPYGTIARKLNEFRPSVQGRKISEHYEAPKTSPAGETGGDPVPGAAPKPTVTPDPSEAPAPAKPTGVKPSATKPPTFEVVEEPKPPVGSDLELPKPNFWLQENLGQLEGKQVEGKDLQQVVRKAAPSIAKTKADMLVRRDMPKINQILREKSGVENPEDFFKQALIDARQEAVQNYHGTQAQQYRDTGLREFVDKKAGLLEHAKFLDSETKAGLSKKLKEIDEFVGDNALNRSKWIDENFTIGKDGLYHTPGDPKGYTHNNLIEMWQGQIDKDLPKLAADLFHLKKIKNIGPNTDTDNWLEAEQALGKGLRMQWTTARTHRGLEGAIRDKRFNPKTGRHVMEEEFGVHPDDVPKVPGFKEALDIYKAPGGIESELRSSYGAKGGVDTPGGMGRYDTYYPLIAPADESAGQGFLSRATERTRRLMRKSAPANYASGLLDKYSRDPRDLSRNLYRAILGGNQETAQQELLKRPDIYGKFDKLDDVPEGWEVVRTTAGTRRAVDTPMGRIEQDSPGPVFAAPKLVARELRVLFDRSPYDRNLSMPGDYLHEYSKGLADWMIRAELAGPADNVMHILRIDRKSVV